MKKTVEIPDALLRAAKAAAAQRGVSLETYLIEAVEETLGARPRPRSEWPVPPPRLAKGAIEGVRAVIDTEFARVDPEAWR